MSGTRPRISRQSVVGDGIPSRGRCDVLPIAWRDSKVSIQDAQSDADPLRIRGVNAPEAGPASCAEHLMVAIRRYVGRKELVPEDDAERARLDAPLQRPGRSGAPLTALAVTPTSGDERGVYLEVDAAAQAPSPER